MIEPDKDPFYVGYLPLPKAIKRFIVPWLVGNVVLAIGLAAVISQQHREPGEGVWETGQPIEVKGEIFDAPYPILKTEDQGTFLLVEQGKVGAQERIRRLDHSMGPYYSVRGYLVLREGRKVIELDSAIQDPILPVSFFRPLEFPNVHDLGTHTLRGEIVDPKCYLGVMQPGDGKTHKTCATLCIKGGIPPMLVVKNTAGQTAAYLLTDSDGKVLPESHHEYIADPIEVTGRVLQDGDLLILRADLASIKRLD